MDLSFSPFDRREEVTPLPSELSALAGRIAARHAPAEPASGAEGAHRGAFNDPMAAALTRWKGP